jgi:hypothetical protein
MFWDRQPLLIQAIQLGISAFDRAHLKSKTLSMLLYPLALISQLLIGDVPQGF